MNDNLSERVEQFRCLELPGQPMSMHMGTSYLISDLWKEVERVTAERDALLSDAQDLALMIGRLVTALRKARPMAPNDLDYLALDLLTRKGLKPSPLRNADAARSKT